MQRKKNEAELGTMMRFYKFYAHKFGDMRYCPFCHSLLPKAEKKPDYLVSFDHIIVEAKYGGERWAWSTSITPNQYELMPVAGNKAWLFLEMGEGNAPKGRSAYLVPWDDWILIQKSFEEKGFKSLVYKSAGRSRNPDCTCIEKYACTWNKGHWEIPVEHVFWATNDNHRYINQRKDDNGPRLT